MWCVYFATVSLFEFNGLLRSPLSFFSFWRSQLNMAVPYQFPFLTSPLPRQHSLQTLRCCKRFYAFFCFCFFFFETGSPGKRLSDSSLKIFRRWRRVGKERGGDGKREAKEKEHFSLFICVDVMQAFDDRLKLRSLTLRSTSHVRRAWDESRMWGTGTQYSSNVTLSIRFLVSPKSRPLRLD